MPPYWPVDPPTATDSERLSEGGGGEELKLRVETRVNAEYLNNQSAAEDVAPPSSPESSQQPMRLRGEDHVIC